MSVGQNWLQLSCVPDIGQPAGCLLPVSFGFFFSLKEGKFGGECVAGAWERNDSPLDDPGKFSLAIVHKDVQLGLACTTRPDIDNVSDVFEEESLFRLTEGNHVALDKHKSSAIANIRKCHQPNVLQEAASRCICGSVFSTNLFTFGLE